MSVAKSRESSANVRHSPGRRFKAVAWSGETLNPPDDPASLILVPRGREHAWEAASRKQNDSRPTDGEDIRVDQRLRPSVGLGERKESPAVNSSSCSSGLVVLQPSGSVFLSICPGWSQHDLAL
ncbi:unnamed protein product [Gadus morhua 'NCC']